MKTSTQLKALIRNLSKEKHVEAEVILRSFMMERFLERVSLSEYKRNFILKGGMLIAAIVGVDTRTTMDMDATMKARDLSETEITTMIQTILRVPMDDAVLFTFKSIEQIHGEATYPGYRISIEAAFDKTKQMLKLDITTGDFITPKEIEYRYKLMFEERAIDIMAYNLETVLAEKFETVIIRNVVNTRMRDFYDIYILTTTQQFDAAVFRAALEKTVEERHTSVQLAGLEETISTIAASGVMIDQWQRYQKKYNYAADVTWEAAVKALERLVVMAKA